MSGDRSRCAGCFTSVHGDVDVVVLRNGTWHAECLDRAADEWGRNHVSTAPASEPTYTARDEAAYLRRLADEMLAKGVPALFTAELRCHAKDIEQIVAPASESTEDQQEPPRPLHLAWTGTEWVDSRCGCRYHPDDDNMSHGGAPHVHLCERHASVTAAVLVERDDEAWRTYNEEHGVAARVPPQSPAEPKACPDCFVIPALHERHSADCKVAAAERIAEYDALRAEVARLQERVDTWAELKAAGVTVRTVVDQQATIARLTEDLARECEEHRITARQFGETIGTLHGQVATATAERDGARRTACDYRAAHWGRTARSEAIYRYGQAWADEHFPTSAIPTAEPRADACSSNVHVWPGSVHIYGPGQFRGDERCQCGAVRARDFEKDPDAS